MTKQRQRSNRSHSCEGFCYLWEVNVTVGQMLRLVVVVGRVCNACVILLHGLVLREGRLFRLQLGVHHVAAHQGLGPTRHCFCISTNTWWVTMSATKTIFQVQSFASNTSPTWSTANPERPNPSLPNRRGVAGGEERRVDRTRLPDPGQSLRANGLRNLPVLLWWVALLRLRRRRHDWGGKGRRRHCWGRRDRRFTWEGKKKVIKELKANQYQSNLVISYERKESSWHIFLR